MTEKKLYDCGVEDGGYCRATDITDDGYVWYDKRLLPCPFCGILGVAFCAGQTSRWREMYCVACEASCGEFCYDAPGDGTTATATATAPAPAPATAPATATATAPADILAGEFSETPTAKRILITGIRVRAARAEFAARDRGDDELEEGKCKRN